MASSSWIEDDDDDVPPRWYDTDDEDAEDELPEYISPEEAGDELIETLLEIKHKFQVPAKFVCVICYYAAAAGAVGPCKEFVARPAKCNF